MQGLQIAALTGMHLVTTYQGRTILIMLVKHVFRCHVILLAIEIPHLQIATTAAGELLMKRHGIAASTKEP